MNFRLKLPIFLLLFAGSIFLSKAQTANEIQVQIKTSETFQTITGFGASLAYYEGWLTAHPNKTEIYDVIFKELSLDILRVRNAHGYDASMMTRVKEFTAAAQKSLGHPIPVLVTSWGPPAYLKSNNDKGNGGTLKYTVSGGKVNFDYAGFARWWNESLNAYNAAGIQPTYISIQNEPDWKASYESCLLKPSETINSTDTIAGYNKALDAVYDTVMKRSNPPKFLGPECIGIGYNAVENYVNALDTKKLFGIGHHLYHGAEGGTNATDPFTSSNYQKVGKYKPEIPHFQTEYSRADWYSVAAMMYMSLMEENATAYLYWDLAWSEGGLVNLHFPWDKTRWTNAKGYNRTKDFYVFKHYSAYIHPGWKRAATSYQSDVLKTGAFISSTGDSATFIVINRSEKDTLKVQLSVPGFTVTGPAAFTTSANADFQQLTIGTGNSVNLAPRSITTVAVKLSKINTGTEPNPKNPDERIFKNYPNPFSESTLLQIVAGSNTGLTLDVFDIHGKQVLQKDLGVLPAGITQVRFYRSGLQEGIYLFRVSNRGELTGSGRFVIAD